MRSSQRSMYDHLAMHLDDVGSCFGSFLRPDSLAELSSHSLHLLY
jgi:hypothetical protein